MRANRAVRGFSLVEVATSIGVIAFALVALIGVFPLGLENSRLTVADTRATQFVKMISATLESETFTASDCFSPPTAPLAKIDFTSIGTDGALNTNPDIVLYASYDVTQLPRLVRATVPTADAIYRVELRCEHENFTPLTTGATARVVGTQINIRVFGLKDKKAFAESWIYVPNYSHVANFGHQ